MLSYQMLTFNHSGIQQFCTDLVSKIFTSSYSWICVPNHRKPFLATPLPFLLINNEYLDFKIKWPGLVWPTGATLNFVWLYNYNHIFIPSDQIKYRKVTDLSASILFNISVYWTHIWWSWYTNILASHTHTGKTWNPSCWWERCFYQPLCT